MFKSSFTVCYFTMSEEQDKEKKNMESHGPSVLRKSSALFFIFKISIIAPACFELLIVLAIRQL